MRITVRHDRHDKGWLILKEGELSSRTHTLYKKLIHALIEARKLHPEAEIWLDGRAHVKFGNGIVMLAGNDPPMRVEYV